MRELLFVLAGVLIGAGVGVIVASLLAARRRATLEDRLAQANESRERLRAALRGVPGLTIPACGRIISDCGQLEGALANQAATVLRAMPQLAQTLAAGPVPLERCADPDAALRWSEHLRELADRADRG